MATISVSVALRRFIAAKSDPAGGTGMRIDLLPELSSFIGRICSGYAPRWGVLRTQLV